jgi:hypothetical protein
MLDSSCMDPSHVFRTQHFDPLISCQPRLGTRPGALGETQAVTRVASHTLCYLNCCRRGPALPARTTGRTCTIRPGHDQWHDSDADRRLGARAGLQNSARQSTSKHESLLMSTSNHQTENSMKGFWDGFKSNATAVGVYFTILVASCGSAVYAQR